MPAKQRLLCGRLFSQNFILLGFETQSPVWHKAHICTLQMKIYFLERQNCFWNGHLLHLTEPKIHSGQFGQPNEYWLLYQRSHALIQESQYLTRKIWNIWKEYFKEKLSISPPFCPSSFCLLSDKNVIKRWMKCFLQPIFLNDFEIIYSRFLKIVVNLSYK